MAMKPTPTKVVLLMSAAGLGMSLPGLALASRDNAPPGFALNFGVHPRSEQDCSSWGLDALASCLRSGSELRQTIVADTTALPLLLAPLAPSTDLKATFRALDAYATTPTLRAHEARAGSDRPPPDDKVPLPEVPVAVVMPDGSNRDPEFDALAMVLLEHEAADSAAASSAPTGRSVPAAPRALDHAAAADPDAGFAQPIGKGIRGAARTLAVDTSSAPDAKLPEGSLDLPEQRARVEVKLARVALGIPVPATQSAAGGGKATAAFGDDATRLPDAATFQAEDHRARRVQVGASKDPTSLASLESVWASLAEVLGSQLEESSLALAPSQESAAAPKRDGAPRASVAVVAVDPLPGVSPPPIDVPGIDSNSLWRSSEADNIVVASSHSDKILLSLAALRSGQGSEMGSAGAQMKKTIVVRHTDKVLETLALFQARRPKRADFACTQTPEEGDRRNAPGTESDIWDAGEQAGKSAIIAFAHDVDILLDLSPPVADRSSEPAMQAAPARPVPPEVPATDRADRRAIGNDMVALSSDKLDEVRGGFITDTGLKVSFGIERAVYLNGSLVTTTSLNIADLSKISGGQVQVTGTGTGSLALVQSGTGNVFSPGSISSSGTGTVIQNTLDNQKINTVTRIDAVVNSAGIMRSINLQSSMRSAVIDSLRR